jgi:hypothetical protein
MRAEGLDLDACIRIIRAGENKADPTAAERKRRQRKREKDAQEANGHAVTVTRDKGSNDIDILTSQASSPIVISDEITPPAEISIVTEEQVLEAYNAMAEMAGLSKARMTPERRKKLKTFVKRHPIDDITEAIWAIPKSRFLCGENDRGWKADLDFLLEPKKFTRLLEGSYAH